MWLSANEKSIFVALKVPEGVPLSSTDWHLKINSQCKKQHFIPLKQKYDEHQLQELFSGNASF